MWNYVITDLKKRIMGVGGDAMDGESFPVIETVGVDGLLFFGFFFERIYYKLDINCTEKR